jgi:flagellar basal-body rod protein FlgF
MLRGLYTATAGMITQQRKHDNATNNIANMNTTGFKAGNVTMRSFPEMLIQTIRDQEKPGSTAIGRLNTGVFAEEAIPLFTQGDMFATSKQTDLAIVSNIQVPGVMFDQSGIAVTEGGEMVYQPQAFFTVGDGSGNGEERYTRNGEFTVNEAGEWVTGSGMRLLGVDGQPFRMASQPEDVQITPNGRVFDRYTGAQLVDENDNPLQIRISIIDNPYNLIREGNGNFRLAEGSGPVRLLQGEDGVQVMQGYEERSNVDTTATMVEMMTAQRAYESNQKIVQYYDRSMEKAVNEVGRV